MNKCYFSGRLTKDPELRYTTTGTAVCQFTLAVDRYAKKDEERQADFLNFVIWQKRAEAIAQYVKKGDQLFVEARVQTRSYENKEGQRVYVTEFVVEDFDFGKQAGGTKTGGNSGQSTREQAGVRGYVDPNANPFANDQRPIDISDDDLPF